MASIQFYADADDFKLIVQRLNDDPEIALIVADGPKRWIRRRRWIARREIGQLGDGRYSLWHVPSGPLPLLRRSMFGRTAEVVIEDPFMGWKEYWPGNDARVPFFGASAPGIIELFISIQAREAQEGIGQSSFGWIGSRYRDTGSPASSQTIAWWRALQHWVRQIARAKVTRWGPLDGPDPDIWAFPGAHRQILAGRHRDTNPCG